MTRGSDIPGNGQHSFPEQPPAPLHHISATIRFHIPNMYIMITAHFAIETHIWWGSSGRRVRVRVRVNVSLCCHIVCVCV